MRIPLADQKLFERMVETCPFEPILFSVYARNGDLKVPDGREEYLRYCNDNGIIPFSHIKLQCKKGQVDMRYENPHYSHKSLIEDFSPTLKGGRIHTIEMHVWEFDVFKDRLLDELTRNNYRVSNATWALSVDKYYIRGNPQDYEPKGITKTALIGVDFSDDEEIEARHIKPRDSNESEIDEKQLLKWMKSLAHSRRVELEVTRPIRKDSTKTKTVFV